MSRSTESLYRLALASRTYLTNERTNVEGTSGHGDITLSLAREKSTQNV